MYSDENYLVPAKTGKDEWLAPKISLMNAQATESGNQPFAQEQLITAGPNAGQPTTQFGS